uniref:Sushi domain-containing protein n=1 Tax=Octopus bimaculoides TaxID=37653 RepID=A0A0L8FSA5_OCTBM
MYIYVWKTAAETVAAKYVPHLFTEDHKQSRLNAWRGLKEQLEVDAESIPEVITGDVEEIYLHICIYLHVPVDILLSIVSVTVILDLSHSHHFMYIYGTIHYYQLSPILLLYWLVDMIASRLRIYIKPVRIHVCVPACVCFYMNAYLKKHFYINRIILTPCSAQPPNIENGRRVYIGWKHGDRAKYMCFQGFRLRGDLHMTCRFGRWVGSRPYCDEIFCPNPGKLENGKIHKKGQIGKFEFKAYIVTIRHGDRLLYECDRGYELDGASGATCVDGNWSPIEKPECKPGQHPILHKLWKPIEEQAHSNQYYL